MPPNLVPDFTLEELLAHLTKSNEPLEGYWTTVEWADKLGICEDRIRSLQKLAKKQRKLLVTRQPREAVDGHIAKVPVYAFQLEKE